MRSIALYVHYTENQNDGQREESQSVDKSISEELHINIWKVQQGHLLLQPKLYIDFGIMTTFQTDQLCLYLPFRIVGTPTDLGQILQNNREMLCTVFNENLLSETQPNNCYSSVKKSSSTNECPLFYLFQLGSENMRVQEQKEGALQGTYIFIVRNGGYDNRETHDKDDWNKKVYIRFRVEQ